MFCKKPITVPKAKFFKNRLDKLQDPNTLPEYVVPCGQCLACRINKRRQWTLRLLLEFTQHEKASFITLTYDPQYLPVSDASGKVGRGVLCKRDVQLFLKKLRKRFDDRKIRYYCAGEYGPGKTKHPHYHIILFGIDADELDEDWFYFRGRSGPCPEQRGMRHTPLYDTWQYGIVHVGEVNAHSIAYVAGYVTSKMTRKGDGYTPEFALMSRMPGIGREPLFDIARHLQALSPYCDEPFDPRQIHCDGKLWPSGRYILDTLRIISDIRDGTEEYCASLAADYRAAQQQGIGLLSFLVAKNEQAFLDLEAKEKIFRQRNRFEE